MADIEHALKGIDFPKSKSEIISYALRATVQANK